MTFKKAQAKTIKVGVFIFKTQKAMNDQKNTQDDEASKVPKKKKTKWVLLKTTKKKLRKNGDLDLLYYCSLGPFSFSPRRYRERVRNKQSSQ